MKKVQALFEHQVWHSDRQTHWQVAVGGDFLPVMELESADSHQWAAQALHLKPYFADIDYAIVNFECPVASEGLIAEAKEGLGANLYAAGASVNFLTELGVDLVGLANNHMMDYGSEGVRRSHDALRSAGLDFIGAPTRLHKKPEVKVVNLSGVQIGVWSAFLNAGKANIGKTGVEPASDERSKDALAQMGSVVSYRIALIHGGLERTHYPDPSELKCLHGFMENGFDLVCVCHSHRISGYAAITNQVTETTGFCFHGMGSILSGCIYGRPEREGIIVVCGLDSNGLLSHVKIRPVWLEGPGWGRIPNRIVGQSIVDRFERISAEITSGDFRKHFYHDIGQNMWHRLIRDVRAAYANRGLDGIGSKLMRIRSKHVNRLLNKILP